MDKVASFISSRTSSLTMRRNVALSCLGLAVILGFGASLRRHASSRRKERRKKRGSFKVRFARRNDLKHIYRMVCDLADYLGERDAMINTFENFELDFRRQRFEMLVATSVEKDAGNNIDKDATREVLIGFAAFFSSYSTWSGSCLWLDDIYVLEEYRGRGVGTQLFSDVAKQAMVHHCARLCWESTRQNVRANAWYSHIGATSVDHHLWRLAGRELHALGYPAHGFS